MYVDRDVICAVSRVESVRSNRSNKSHCSNRSNWSNGSNRSCRSNRSNRSNGSCRSSYLSNRVRVDRIGRVLIGKVRRLIFLYCGGYCYCGGG